MKTSRLAVAIGVGTTTAILACASARAEDPATSGTGRVSEARHFTIDPMFDGVLIAAAGGFAGVLTLVLNTGEIKPNLPGDPAKLSGIDHVAVTQTIDPHAARYSTIGVSAALAYAVVDPILSGIKGGRDGLLVDAILYGETLALTLAFNDMTKIAVRRPRPIDYIDCSSTVNGDCTTNTDLQLSFYSQHAAVSAAVTGTATYLAFVRDPHGKRPWITLGAGSLLTAFVSYERVRAGQHFPTDVLVGSLAGASVGVLVCHIHRHRNEIPVLVGFAPTGNQGGSLTVRGWF